MAYLKAHYLDEFIGALLEVYTGKPKEPAYVREARRCGMRLAPPDVNVSGPAWTLDKMRTRAVIRKGLASLKGVGVPCATELQSKAPFKSLEDLIARCNGRAVTGGKEFIVSGDINELRGNLKALYEAQALDSVID
jgi:DNA polymerase-3 subunit alpha